MKIEMLLMEQKDNICTFQTETLELADVNEYVAFIKDLHAQEIKAMRGKILDTYTVMFHPISREKLI